MIALLQTQYDFQDANTIYEVLRAWLNTNMFDSGLRFSANTSNAIMLVTALIFIFLLELLLTIGIQVWERRVLGRIQSRRGPKIVGNITPESAKRVVLPISILLGIPAVLYGLQYWTSPDVQLPHFEFSPSLIVSILSFTAAVIAVWWALGTGDETGLRRRVGNLPLCYNDLLGAGIILLPLVLPRLLPGSFIATFPTGMIILAAIIYFCTRKFSQLRFLQDVARLPRLVVGAGVVLIAVFAYNMLQFVPPIRLPGSMLSNLVALCTLIAFVIYLVYCFGYYWRQGLADALKIFSKEDVVPLNADRFLFTVAPILVYLPALLSWVVIPFGIAVIAGHTTYYMVQDLNVGLLLIIADFALFLVAIIMSGYASNNKYALVGAMREAAMLLTYEVPMLMSLLCVALFAGSLNLTEIVQRQTMTWGILPLLPAFAIYLVISLAETNRPPFDLPEAQNELLGGYLVEYSGLRFALFYIAEYSNVFIVSAIMTVCFLGGWKGPMFLGPEGLWLTSLFWFLIKTYALIYFFIWARATMPRIRMDQIMFFSWKFLLPASVVCLGITALGVVYRHPWFNANRIGHYVAETESYQYLVLPTREVLEILTATERAFFWGYSVVTVLFSAFIIWLAWRVLFNKRKHPLPRREVTWS